MKRNKILLVDDNQPATNYIGDYLIAADFEVAVVQDQPTALQTVRQDQPDLMLLACQLIACDSLEIVRTIRADPVFHRLPIMVIGTAFDPAEAIVALEQGADEYLARSIKPSEVIARVRAILRRCYPQDYRAGPELIDTEINGFDPVKVAVLNEVDLVSQVKLYFLLVTIVLLGVGLITGLLLWLVF